MKIIWSPKGFVKYSAKNVVTSSDNKIICISRLLIAKLEDNRIK